MIRYQSPNDYINPVEGEVGGYLGQRAPRGRARSSRVGLTLVVQRGSEGGIEVRCTASGTAELQYAVEAVCRVGEETLQSLVGRMLTGSH